MSSADQSKMRETIEATARAFFSSYKNASDAKDTNLITRMRTPDCKLFARPMTLLASAGLPADFAGGNEMCVDSSLKMMGVCDFVRVDVLNLTVDVAARKAAALINNHIRFVGGGWEEDGVVLEYAYYLDLTDDGTLVKQIVQFVAPEIAMGFMRKVGELGEVGENEAAAARKSTST